VGKELGYTKWSDWYQIKVQDIQNRGGDSLLRRFHLVPSQMVQHIYPEHPWQREKFIFD